MSNNVPLPAKLEVSRPGDHFLVTIPHHWGRGATLDEARKKCLSVAGQQQLGRYWRVYSAHPKTQLDELGCIVSPKGHPPVVLAESNPTR